MKVTKKSPKKAAMSQQFTNLMPLFFQQGEVVYELVGDYPSQSFFWVDSASGVLYVRNSLQADSLESTEYPVRTSVDQKNSQIDTENV